MFEPTTNLPFSQPAFTLAENVFQLQKNQTLNSKSFDENEASSLNVGELGLSPSPPVTNLQSAADGIGYGIDWWLDYDQRQQHIKNKPKDYGKTFEQIVKDNGFHFASYDVTTSDGYILTIFRIRTAKVAQSNEAPVVFFQHGLISSADMWIGHRPELAPAFQFAKEGYDVWLGNSRGNSHGRRHTHLNADKDAKEFFNFTFKEFGEFDLPASVDFVREKTGNKKVTYVGHSQGTTLLFYAMAKKNREYFETRFNLFVLMAPIMNLKHQSDSLISGLASNKNDIDYYIKKYGVYEIYGKKWKENMKIICGFSPGYCHWGDVLNVWFQKKYNDEVRLDAVTSKFPQSTSWKDLSHWGQIAKSKTFEEYDYKSQNQQIYG